ncbi:MAG: hypothetical protein AB1331_08945 [Bacillota bacterium]
MSTYTANRVPVWVAVAGWSDAPQLEALTDVAPLIRRWLGV